MRADRLRLLAEVGRRTTAILAPEELFGSAVRIIQETFRYFMVSIFLVEGKDLVARACTMPQFEQYIGHLRLPIGGSGITCWVAAHNAPLVVPDVRRDPRYHYELEVERSTRSELAVPIALKGCVIGVLDVQSERPAAFTELDTFTLETVADQLAVAIENARLYDELRRELVARERASSLLRSLHEAGLAMQRAASPEEVFPAVGDVLRAKGISCTLTLLDGPPVRAYASPGAPSEPEGPPPGGRGTQFTPGCIAAPLLFEDRLLGHLRVFSDTLSPEDVPAMQVFANEIAAAWRKAHLVRDLQESLRALQSAQEQLLQSQKMEAVGRLAGGVAHDFNNQLTAIIGYAELLGTDVPEGDPRQTDVKEIVKAARRAADLTRQLLAFSRKQVLRPSLVDLNALVEDMRALLRRLIGEDVRLETRYAAGPLNVVADPTQVQQVIMNLAVNSRDAMPGGGTLTIATGRLPGAGPDGWCLLEVTDTGTGMDPETLGRLFEPFFTTKEVGKGTGLGLSTVYGIVRQSGGDISCRSAAGHGTTFTIRLPAAAGRVEPSAVAAEPVPARGGREAILVVEDEEPVLELVRRTLAGAGYTVRTARTGREGLAVLCGATRLDMVITDLVLPDGTSGLELARRVLEQKPGTRLLCVSGYSEQLVTGADTLPAGSFLQKPFTPAEILSAVRRALDTPRDS
jgi:signal transduction histidine kinase/putative methionine-R-sulfoxide reductase with GAF domain/ActR/RegA family two-component response regulator